MKKLLIAPALFITLMLFLFGCVTLEKGVGDVALEIAARHTAYQIGKSDPVVIEPGILLLTAMLESDNPEPLQEEMWNYLLARYKDNPMLVADIKSLISLIEIKTPSLVGYQRLIISALQGLEYAKLEGI